jgi:RNA polymerase sigma-70 factor (ECF subfamily)
MTGGEIDMSDRLTWRQARNFHDRPNFHGSPAPCRDPLGNTNRFIEVLGVDQEVAAEHCKAAQPADTDWAEIVRLYDRLERMQPSPIVSLNRAVAVAMMEGPRAGLAVMDGVAATNDLNDYHLLHAARADLLRRLGLLDEAAKSYVRALALVTNDSERRFLERRLREVQRDK